MKDDGRTPSDLPVRVDLSAKARATFELKTEIPKESTGRLVDALTDMIRPFAERRGLKADNLRLQREEVLLEIAKRARQRAAEENLQILPVPNKFMVPFLEKASIEETDSGLVEQWANLLLSASEDYNSRYVLYSNALSNLGPEDVRFLERMIKESRGTATVADLPYTYHTAPDLFNYAEITGAYDSSFDEDARTDVVKMMDLIHRYERPGVYIRYIGFLTDRDIHRDISRDDNGYPHKEQFSISALESQGIIKSYDYKNINNPFGSLCICVLTHLGVDFYRSCARPKD